VIGWVVTTMVFIFYLMKKYLGPISLTSEVKTVKENFNKIVNLKKNDITIMPIDNDIGGLTQEEKKIKDDIFFTKNGYTYDMAMVLPSEDMFKKRFEDKNNKKLLLINPGEIITKLRLAGLNTFQYYSSDAEEIIVEIRCPLDRLKYQADIDDYQLLLDEDNIHKRALKGYEFISQDGKLEKIAPFEIADGFEDGLTTIRQYQYIFGRYDQGYYYYHILIIYLMT
jgi:hypothetical protein